MASKIGVEAAALRDRWTPEQRERVGQAFRERTVYTPFTPLTAGDVEYQDLRGFTIRDPIRDMTLDHVDLSHARFEWVGAFLGITAIDCLFVGATLDQNLSGTYRRCRFDAAKMGGATIFGGSTFSECTFVRTNMQATKGTALSFDHCDFSGANFKSTRLSESAFRGCKWDDVRFTHSSLGSSTITRAGFPVEKGVQASDRILPDVILDHVKWLD
jgi:uncharacterized protein YjbI with pentapeptide repeats